VGTGHERSLCLCYGGYASFIATAIELAVGALSKNPLRLKAGCSAAE
jgi:hypothetical protein